MSVRKRGSQWWYDFTVDGQRYRKPIPEARTKRKAEEIEDQVKVSVYNGTYGQPSAKTLAEFVEEVYKPWVKENRRSPSHASEVQVVVAHFGDKPLTDICPLDVERFKRERTALPSRRGGVRRPGTVNLELAALSRILTTAKVAGLIRENPVSQVKWLRVENQRSRYMTEEEEARILADGFHGFDARFKPVFIIAINTGMRLGEIMGLIWSRIDLQRGIIHLVSTKNGKPRDVPINKAVEEVIAGLPHAGDRLFVFSSVNASNQWQRIMRRLGIRGLHFHDLRHHFATQIADLGTDPFTIKELLGHSSLKPTERYTHALERNKRRAVDALVTSAGHVSVTSINEKRQKTG